MRQILFVQDDGVWFMRDIPMLNQYYEMPLMAWNDDGSLRETGETSRFRHCISNFHWTLGIYAQSSNLTVRPDFDERSKECWEDWVRINHPERLLLEADEPTPDRAPE